MSVSTPPTPPPKAAAPPIPAAPAKAPAPAPAPAAPPPPPPKTKPLADQLAASFPEAKLDYLKPKRLKFTVPSAKMEEVAIFARDTLGFDHISTVSGTDYIAKKEMEVIYFAGSVSRPGLEDVIIELAERVERGSPSVSSLVDVWPGTEYHERETYEMLGIAFEGHPDLRRILLPDDWDDIPPLRKDYNSPGR